MSPEADLTGLDRRLRAGTGGDETPLDQREVETRFPVLHEVAQTSFGSGCGASSRRSANCRSRPSAATAVSAI